MVLGFDLQKSFIFSGKQEAHEPYIANLGICTTEECV